MRIKSCPCTVESFQDKHSLTDLDPGTALRSSEVPDSWDKWEDVDLVSVEDILRRHSLLELSLFAKSPDSDDAASFCSILTDKLQYCQSDTPDNVRYFSNDSFKAMNAKQRFFDAAFNNEPCNGSTCINSCNAKSAPKHQLFDVINSRMF